MSDGFSSAIGHRTVTDASVMTFGGLTGDYAQMHFDLSFGPASGMGESIAHGLLSAAWSLGAMTLYAPERLAIGDPRAALAGFEIRFGRMVHQGDRFSLRWKNRADPCVEGLGESATLDTGFEILNQHGERTCSGALSVARGALPEPPRLLSLEPRGELEPGQTLYAEDMIALGPRGESLGRTVTEADVVGYANFTGELNPHYLNAPFAAEGRFGARVAPPMWTFCLGFGDYLRELLAMSMASTGFAGHLGDSWRSFAPVHVGDTLRTRHAPVACTASKSRPQMAVVHFGLQLINQRDEIVQDGRVAMMIPVRG